MLSVYDLLPVSRKKKIGFVICISSEYLNLVYTYAMDITAFVNMVSLNFYQPMHDDSLQIWHKHGICFFV